jgi:hypothetical protein
MKPWLGVVILGMTLTGRSGAQVDDIRGYPGYVNLELISVPEKAEKAVDVTIGPRLMRVVRETGRLENETRSEAKRIISLQVKSFAVNAEDAEKMKPLILEFERQLKKEDWRPVIQMRRPDRLTNVSVKYGRGRKMDGFFIMSVNPGSEASFINIIGDVDPELLKGMLVNVNEDVLDSLRKSMEKHQTSLEERRKSLKRIQEDIEIKRKKITDE